MCADVEGRRVDDQDRYSRYEPRRNVSSRSVQRVGLRRRERGHRVRAAIHRCIGTDAGLGVGVTRSHLRALHRHRRRLHLRAGMPNSLMQAAQSATIPARRVRIKSIVNRPRSLLSTCLDAVFRCRVPPLSSRPEPCVIAVGLSLGLSAHRPKEAFEGPTWRHDAYSSQERLFQ